MKRLWLCVFLPYLVSSSRIIKVSPQGHDRVQCLQDSTSPCETLGFVCRELKDFTSVKIVLSQHKHLLTNNCNIQNAKDFSLVGDTSKGSIIQCSNTNSIGHIGFNFLRSSGLIFKNFTVEKCKSKQKSTSVSHPALYSGMFFAYCRDVHFNNVILRENYGVGINMYDVGGNVLFTGVSFIRNSENNTDMPKCQLSDLRKMATQSGGLGSRNHAGGDTTEKASSGGGIYIEYTSCGALPPFNCNDTSETKQYNHNSIFTFQKCRFIENLAEHVRLNPEGVLGATHKAFGRGGGMSFYFRGSSRNNFVYISNSTFDKNCALWGAGLYVEFDDATQGNRILVGNETIYKQNHATLGGGGVRVIDACSEDMREGNVLEFQSTTFYNNAALWGGGMSVSGRIWRDKHDNYTHARTIQFKKCTFQSNFATVGSAMGVVCNSYMSEYANMGLPFRVLFDTCQIMDNKIDGFNDTIVGQGAIYSEGVPIDLMNGTQFSKNLDSALVLVSAPATVKGIVTFNNNSGLHGGAIALYGHSWIIMTKGAKLELFGNKVKGHGGAIYFKPSGPPRLAFQTTELTTASCFIHYHYGNNMVSGSFDPKTWECSIHFVNNTAPKVHGNSIYATTLQNCRKNGESRYNIRSISEKPFVYDSYNDNEHPHIVTSANKIKFNDNEWQQPPSMAFSPHLTITDELSNQVYSTVNLTLSNTPDTTKLVSTGSLFRTNSEVRGIEIYGQTGTDFNFQFQTASGQIVFSDKGAGKLQNCPLGYYQKWGTNICTCLSKEEGNGIIDCKGRNIYVITGSWAYENRGYLDAIACPRHYCQCQDVSDYKCLFIQDRQCADNRTGTLCGSCENGLSVKLGSEACAKCSNMYLLLFLPCLLVLSILVLIVMYLDIDAFSGYLNAYVYSYQVLSLILSEKIQLDYFIGFVVGITGLTGTGNSVGICLYDGMDNLWKVAVNFLLTTYTVVFTIFVGVGLSNNLWQKVFGKGHLVPADARNRSFGRAFAIVCVYCYSSYTQVVMDVLHPVKIHEKWKPYLSADKDEYFHGRHLVFGLVAIFVLIFVVIGFPVVLACPACFTRAFKWIQRAEPILDSLRDCFQNKEDSDTERRFFAAFYFLCRLLLILCSTLLKHEATKLIALALLCILIQFIFCLFHPYKKWTMNWWDSLLLLNLTLISFASLVISVPYMVGSHTSKILEKIIAFGLVYIPLVSVIGRLFAALYRARRERNVRTWVDEEPSVTSFSDQPHRVVADGAGGGDDDNDNDSDGGKWSCFSNCKVKKSGRKGGFSRLPQRVLSDPDFDYRQAPNAT